MILKLAPELLTGSAGGKTLAQMTARKNTKIFTYEYTVYLNDKALFTKLDDVAFVPQSVTL